jgi:hypothetical protein
VRGRAAEFSTEDRAHIGNSSDMARWLACLLLVGCVRVKAYQREYLAKPTMNPEAAPLEQKMDTHVQEYREGSMGGTGVGGGGCGCN